MRSTRDAAFAEALAMAVPSHPRRRGAGPEPAPAPPRRSAPGRASTTCSWSATRRRRSTASPGPIPSLLVDVADRFPGIEVIRLPVNHRCTPQVVQIGRGDPAEAEAGTRRSSRLAPTGRPRRSPRHDDERRRGGVRSRRRSPRSTRHSSAPARWPCWRAPTPRWRRPGSRAHRQPASRSRRPVDGAGSVLTPLLDEAYRLRDTDRLRQWDLDQHELRRG